MVIKEIGSTRPERVKFLMTYTDYPESYLYSLYDGQLFKMCESIRRAMINYPKQILDYQERHPELRYSYTKDELLNMKYNELAAIRKRYGIKGNKVVKVEEAKAVSKKASAVISKQATRETIVEIMNSNSEEFLTDEEIELMGFGEHSSDELAMYGIYRADARDQRLDGRERNFEKIINLILKSNLSISGNFIKEDDLLNYSDEELRLLLKTINNVWQIRFRMNDRKADSIIVNTIAQADVRVGGFKLSYDTISELDDNELDNLYNIVYSYLNRYKKGLNK